MSKHQPIIYQAMQGKRPVAIRTELLETDPMHADMLRYDQAFHHPTDVSLVIFPHFRLKGPGGLYPDKITIGRWGSFCIMLQLFLDLGKFGTNEHVTDALGIPGVDDFGIHNQDEWIGYVHEVPGYALRKITLGQYMKEHPKKIAGWREV